MAVTGSITTRFIDEKGVDLGKTLIEKDYLISVYPNLLNQFDTPMLMTWGFNANNGNLGDNTTTNRSSPVQTIAYGANWKQVSSGSYHTACIKTDGTLWIWGWNYRGQIGDNTSTNVSSPVQTITFGTNWKNVSSGVDHCAAIKTDGTLWCWGRNIYGQLGDNTITDKSSPVQTIAFGTNWKQVSAGNGTFAAGGNNTAAIKTDGTLWCWGLNSTGQLGDNTVINRSSPVQTIAFGTNWKQVSAGNGNFAAIKNDGTLWTCGYNLYGQLGDNSIVKKSSPVQTVAYGTNWKQVSCGHSHTAAIKTDGTLWIWGGNTTYGNLGDNTTVSRSSPVQTIAYGTNWKSVTCASQHTAAIKTDGTLWIWGDNQYGQLGNNTLVSKSSPIQTILYGPTWKSVSCGQFHAAAIKDGDF